MGPIRVRKTWVPADFSFFSLRRQKLENYVKPPECAGPAQLRYLNYGKVGTIDGACGGKTSLVPSLVTEWR